MYVIGSSTKGIGLTSSEYNKHDDEVCSSRISSDNQVALCHIVLTLGISTPGRYIIGGDAYVHDGGSARMGPSIGDKILR